MCCSGAGNTVALLEIRRSNQKMECIDTDGSGNCDYDVERRNNDGPGIGRDGGDCDYQPS